MEKIVFKENKEYSKDEVLSKLNVDENTFLGIVNRLNKKRILENKSEKFKFRFVGICIIDNKILFINPKHESDKSEDKKVIKLLIEYSKREILDVEEKEYLSYDHNNVDNFLGIIDYLLSDYFENGLYLNQEKIVRINGNGRINWITTIERNSMLLNKKGQPIYTELVTVENNINNTYIITNIYKYIINKCFEKLKELGLLQIFNYEYKQLEINEHYDNKFMLGKLYEEMNKQFQDRKINVLKAMINFINKIGSDSVSESIVVFGTKSFEVVWEKVISYIFMNEYNIFSKYIPIPKWYTLTEKCRCINTRNKIIPDVIKVCNDKFLILDAKYYNINMKVNDHKGILTGNPDSYSVIKQFTYQLAFENLKEDNYLKKVNLNERDKPVKIVRGASKIINAFLFPKDMKSIYEIFGTVKLDVFNLNPILNIYLSSSIIFDMYINNKRLSKKGLEDFSQKCDDILDSL